MVEVGPAADAVVELAADVGYLLLADRTDAFLVVLAPVGVVSVSHEGYYSCLVYGVLFFDELRGGKHADYGGGEETDEPPCGDPSRRDEWDEGDHGSKSADGEDRDQSVSHKVSIELSPRPIVKRRVR